MASRRPLPDDFFSPDVTLSKNFCLHLGGIDKGTFQVVAGGFEECAPDYRVERESFSFYAIEFVASGKGHVALNQQEHRLGPGSVFSYGPRVAQRLETDQDHCLRKFFVNFRGKRALQAMEKAGVSPGYCGVVARPARIAALFEEIVRFGTSPRSAAAQGCGLALQLLLLSLTDERVEASDAGTAKATYDRCYQALQTKYMSYRRVGDWAADCHVDAAYLCRLFQRFLGQSPYRCLGQLQMAWVANQLFEHGRRVSDVAQTLQIDPFQLSRTFRRFYGVSPSHFVRLRRGQSLAP